MSAESKAGDVAGYVLLQEHAGDWVNVDDWQFDSIAKAVSMLEDYQEESPTVTYAVGRIQLSMISRPEDQP